MRIPSQTVFSRRLILLTVVAMAMSWTLGAFADDRELLRDRTSDPYMFIVVDTSGSMHWTPPCSEDDARGDLDPWDMHCTSVCPFDDPTCARVCPNQGCLEYAQDQTATVAQEVIVDNDDTGNVTRSGDWDPSSSGGYDGEYLFLNAGERGDITFTADLPEEAEYNVYVRWVTRSHRAENVETRIDHADGSNYLEIDQSDPQYSDEFTYLGTFRFEDDPATAAFDVKGIVKISNRDADGGSTSADAVRFSRLPRPDDSALVCNAYGYRCQQPLCPQGDCQAPLGADDPTSKFFQARQALDEVLSQVPNVNFGFGSFEQDQAALLFKHFLYDIPEVTAVGNDQAEFNDFLSPSEEIGFTWPITGRKEVLGTGAPYNSTSGLSNDQGFFNCDNTTLSPGDNGYDDDSEIGCTARRPADIEDIWEMDRVHRIPKLGRTAEEETSIFVRDTDDTVYRIDYEYFGFNRTVVGTRSSFGDNVFKIQMDLHECENDDCSDRDTLVSNMDVALNLVSDFASWEGNVQRHPMSGGGFFSNQSGVQATETCSGLEPNNDLDANDPFYSGTGTTGATDDAWWGYPYKMAWRQDPRGNTDIDGDLLATRVDFLDYGDIIPLDWDHKNTDNIRRRLAPNAWRLTAASDPDNSIIGLETTSETPEFRSGVFFNDSYTDLVAGQEDRRRLRLKDETERPLLARGATPLYRSLLDFQEWYAGPAGCDRTSETDPPCGWRAYAEVFDLNWACKQKYVLMLTDGDETCDSVANACTISNTLFDSFQVQTFVIGYGLAEGSGDALTCIAANGGTGEPIYPQNKEDLVERLLDVFDEVKAESRAFASASIPAVQSTAADKIYLSSFTPTPGSSIWPGRVDVFRQPLPLDDDRRPQVTLKCSEDRQSGCHLYEVAEQLLEQAPTDPGNTSLPASERFEIRVGRDDEIVTGVAEAINVSSRRIFYSQENLSNERPGPLRLLWPPDEESSYPGAAADRFDLAQSIVSQNDLAIYFACSSGDCEDDLDAALQDAVRKVVEPREVSITNSDGDEIPCLGDPDDLSNTPCRYIMGDVFHANPQVLGSPDDFDFFRQDLCGTPPDPGQPNNCVPADTFDSAAAMRTRGYREFVRRNVFRRRALITSTNDGQLHFFDAGKYIKIEDEELGDVEVFTDGTGNEMFSYIPRLVLPILRDQLHNDNHIYSLDGSPKVGDVFIDPVPNSLGEYEVEDREWRTVLISGLREAGSIFNSTEAKVSDFESGYYALDLTYPDEFQQAEDDEGNLLAFAPHVPAEPGKFLPTCLDVDDDSGRQKASDSAGCKTLAGESTPFPLELWTFQDTVHIAGQNYFVDEDGNGHRDLGDTWSVPVIGQITVCKEGGTQCAAGNPGDDTDDDLETRWVAMFGGGLDPANINNPQRGDRFYIVDIETGEILLNRQVDGAVPSDPAALDIDNDGIIDRVYFGTTNGTMYKLQLRIESGSVPTIEEQILDADQVLGWAPADPTDTVTVNRITSSLWEPFPIFKNDLPIFYPPSLFKIPTLEQYGLAFGNGYREDLWQEVGGEAAFFVVVDQDFTALDPTLPFDDSDFVHFDWQSSDATDVDGAPITGLDLTSNLLLLDFAASGLRAGWIIDFPQHFKTTNEAFVLSGILIFSVFDPLTLTIESTDPDSGTDAVCAQTGTTYSFVISLQNASSLADLGDCAGRCEVIDEFTTAVHTDRTVSKNPPNEGDDDSTNLGDNTGSIIDEELANAIREAILGLSPRSCQFNENYEVVVSALRNSTGLNVYAKIPLLVCPGDWRHQ